MPLPFLKFFVSVDEKNGCRTSNNQIALNSSGRGGHVPRPLLQAVQAVHGQREGCEQGRPQGGQKRGGRLVLSDHAPRRPREYLGNGFTSNPVTVR